MSAIAVDAVQPGGGIRPRWGPIVVAAVSALAVAAFVWMTRDTTLPYPSFAGACQRLRASGLEITSADWFCTSAIPSTARASMSAASLLIAIGFVVPCMILASTGRRATALLPLVAAPVMTVRDLMFEDVVWSDVLRRDGLLVHVTFALILAAPVVAVMVAVRARERPRPRPVPLLACVATWVLIALPIAGVVRLARDGYVRHFEVLGGELGTTRVLIPAAVAVALFGALLGADRRWWPWAFVAPAVLLSTGPSMSLILGPTRVTDWSRYGSVVPLFAVGVIASAWRPLAQRITPRLRGGTVAISATTTVAPIDVDPDRVRPDVIVGALCAGLLLISMIMFRADPLPTQLSVSLPTYIGVRTTVSDLRTRQLLHRALADMEAFRAEHGTYRGFDGSSDPVLAWQRGLPHATEGPRVPELTMGVETASTSTARLVAVSQSGNAFCLQSDDETVTFGRGDGTSFGTTTRQALREALAGCGSTLWTAAALRPFPVESLCREHDADDGGYVLCRMVQVLLVETLRRTGPA
jgi:hypothetical protein